MAKALIRDRHKKFTLMILLQVGVNESVNKNDAGENVLKWMI